VKPYGLGGAPHHDSAVVVDVVELCAGPVVVVVDAPWLRDVVVEGLVGVLPADVVVVVEGLVVVLPADVVVVAGLVIVVLVGAADVVLVVVLLGVADVVLVVVLLGVADVVLVVVERGVVVVGATVVVEGARVVVVVPELGLATAITGDASAVVGGPVTMPATALLFGYGLQVSTRLLPDTTSSMETVGSTVRLMLPPEAVKGPNDVGDEGRLNVRLAEGTGLGMTASIGI